MIERVDTTARHVWLSGLDLVDGTPVYDIKPYIPWDSVPLNLPLAQPLNQPLYQLPLNQLPLNQLPLNQLPTAQLPPTLPPMKGADSVAASTPAASAASTDAFSDGAPPTVATASPSTARPTRVVVPSWVTASNTELTAVRWTDKAIDAVRDAVVGGHMEPLYGPTLDDLPHVLSAIGEVISQVCT